ncbi:MAG: acyl-CoA synthetase [Deltaproteobacteria bacterium]|nr:acyl-CoA synthetase [Deltaproteobacteria bacterium]
MSFNLADLFECVADVVPERTAVIAGARRFTYEDLDRRANRLAHALATRGVGPGDHVGLQLYNGPEYLEGMLAAFKIRAVPVNVNYRYVEGELRYLFDDADLVALVLHRVFAPRVAAIAGALPKLATFLLVEDGSGVEATLPAFDYEEMLAGQSAARAFAPRSSDDRYCLYTGGTTGMPKGVVWRHEDIFFAAMGGGDPFSTGDFIRHPEELAARVLTPGIVALPTPPFMHASAHWLAFHDLFCGGTIVVPEGGRFDPAEIWELVGRERVTLIVIVGDAMARPLAEELAAHPDRYDTSSVVVIGSGGAILSPATKARLEELLPGRMIVDGFGSSETGTLGNRTGSTFRVNEQTAVLDDRLRPVEPGSGVIGRLARRGHIPIGYYNDPEKTAATFVEVDGVRWVLPGDLATVEADGAVTLLGRGSTSINSGGEKVFPEEVESALKAHPAVFDVVVAGAPDERWGERVVAIVEPRPGTPPTLAELQGFCRSRIAAYKIPRALLLVEKVRRSPAGKADYRWARERAAAAR